MSMTAEQLRTTIDPWILTQHNARGFTKIQAAWHHSQLHRIIDSIDDIERDIRNVISDRYGDRYARITREWDIDSNPPVIRLSVAVRAKRKAATPEHELNEIISRYQSETCATCEQPITIRLTIQ